MLTTPTVPLQLYSNEAELASIIRWVYLKALDFYRIEREDKAGLAMWISSFTFSKK